MPGSALGGHSDFKRLWFGQTVSNFGDRISRIAIPTVAILTLHATVLEVGLLSAVRFLPFLVLGPVAGVWADRLPRRSLMIAADTGRLAVTALVPLAYALDVLSLPLLYAVAAVTAVLTVLFEVSYQSYLPVLVGRDGVVEGNQKLQVSRSLADVGGAAAGGVLMQALGNAVAVLVDSLSFAVSLLGLVLIRHREERPERLPAGRRPGAWAEAREGLRALNSDRRLRALMLSTSTVNLGMATANALLLIYAYEDAKLHPGQVGAAFAIGTVGLILGAILAPAVVSVVPLGATLMATVVATGLSYLMLPAIGVGAALAGLAVAQFVIGFSDSVFNIQVMSLVQRITPEELMGRVSGTALSVVWGSGTFGAALGGVVGAAIGVTRGIDLAGVVIVAGAVFIFLSPVRGLRHQPPAPDADRPGAEPESVSEPEPEASTAIGVASGEI